MAKVVQQLELFTLLKQGIKGFYLSSAGSLFPLQGEDIPIVDSLKEIPSLSILPGVRC